MKLTRVSGPPRRGIILVVVVSLLALFAVVGLSFVLFAESEATAARLYRDAQVAVDNTPPSESPESLLNKALGDLIYDAPDDESGVYNGIRGHSLARSAYGWNYQLLNPQNPNALLLPGQPADNGFRFAPGWNNNTIPFNGTGRLKFDYVQQLMTQINAQRFAGTGNAQAEAVARVFDDLINYTFFQSNGDAIIRDPERYFDPTPPADVPNTFPSTTAGSFRNLPNQVPLQPFTGGVNAPYTYPDANNMFLAAVRASDGRVLMPSFHRSWLFNKDVQGLAAGNPNANFNDFTLHNVQISTGQPDRVHPNWLHGIGRYLTLRPRPIDQLSPALCSRMDALYPGQGLNWPAGLPADGRLPAIMNSSQLGVAAQLVRNYQNRGLLLPYPSDAGGDVKNLPGGPGGDGIGGNDSIWIDLGAPVRQTADGRKYKPLFAYLVTDLDNRININVAGNGRGLVDPDPVSPTNGSRVLAHTSNQGWGRHEINPNYVLDQVSTTAMFPNTPEWLNILGGNSDIPGRYGLMPVAMINSLPPHDPYNYPENAATGNPPPPPHWLAVAMSPYPYGLPVGTLYPRFNPASPIYSRVDLDGFNEATATAGVTPAAITGAVLPGELLPTPNNPDLHDWAKRTLSYPVYGGIVRDSFGNVYGDRNGDGYGDGEGYGVGVVFNAISPTTPLDSARNRELRYHPFLYNPISPSFTSQRLPPNYSQRTFTAAALAPLLLRYSYSERDAGSAVVANAPIAPLVPGLRDSELTLLLPSNLSLAKMRHLITTHSADLSRPGLMPAPSRLNMPTNVDDDQMGFVYQIRDGQDHPFEDPGSALPVSQQLVMPTQPVIARNGYTEMAGNPATGLTFADAFKAVQLQAVDVIPPAPPGLEPALSRSNKPDGRSRSAALGRIDLGRPLTPYFIPQPNPMLPAYPGIPATASDDGTDLNVNYSAPWQNPDPQRSERAIRDRQELARDIFDRLRFAVGAVDPLLHFQKTGEDVFTAPPNSTSQPQFRALKYLAQLAVNIVDFVDEDTYITPFDFGKPFGHPEQYVFGTERPEIVLNEVYAEFNNSQNDQGLSDENNWKPQKPLKGRVFVELTHTLPTPPTLPAGMTQLQFDSKYGVFLRWGSTHTAYQIIIDSTNRVLPQPQVAGQPRKLEPQYVAGFIAPVAGGTQSLPRILGGDNTPKYNGSSTNDFSMPQQQRIKPMMAGQNQGPGYLSMHAGSNDIRQEDAVTLTPPNSVEESKLTYEFQATELTYANPNQPGNMPTVVLRRLACPLLPPNELVNGQPENPNVPLNPYVTVDFFATDLDTANLGGQFYRGGYDGNSGPPLPVPVSARQAFGRVQPFEYAPKQQQQNDSPKNTFGQRNDPNRDTGYDWLVHLDRAPSSPSELFNVSAFAPWELAHKFRTGDAPGQKYRQRAPWLDDFDPVTPPPPGSSARLYRALEFLRCGERFDGAAFGGRDYGKVNINTVWDRETLYALADPRPANHFTLGDLVSDPVGPPQPDTQRGVWDYLAPTWDLQNPNTGDPRTSLTRSPWLNVVNVPPPGPYGLVDTYRRITEFDRPLWGYGAPHAVGGNLKDASGNDLVPNQARYLPDANDNNLWSGRNRTLLRQKDWTTTALPGEFVTAALFDAQSQSDPASLPTSQSGTWHPAKQHELMTKVMEHLTTRSNVFAVYVTVGFFEVTDDTSRPVKLGAELGAAEGKNKRYKMFAIVDRTNLTLEPPVAANANDLSGRLRQGPKPFFLKAERMFSCEQLGNNAAPLTQILDPQVSELSQVWPGMPNKNDPNPSVTNANFPKGLVWVSIPAVAGQSTSNEPNGVLRKDGRLTITTDGISHEIKPDDWLLIDVGHIPTGAGTTSQQAWAKVRAVKFLDTVFDPEQRPGGNPLPDPTKSKILLEIPYRLVPGTGGLDPEWYNNALNQPKRFHKTGFLISNCELGNPGPQAAFDYREPRYGSVVLYSTILE